MTRWGSGRLERRERSGQEEAGQPVLVAQGVTDGDQPAQAVTEQEHVGVRVRRRGEHDHGSQHCQ